MYKQIKIILFSFSNFFLSLPFSILGLSKFNENEARADWQPPGYVFGIVWPILYYLFGLINLKVLFSNITSSKKNQILKNSIRESIFQTSWLFVTGNYGNGRLPIQNILGFIIISLLVYYAYIVRLPSLYTLKSNIFYYYIPYCLWIFFALILNFQIVKNNLKTININSGTVAK